MHHPLIASLLEQGLARADRVGMGFATDGRGELRSAAPGRLFTLGPLRRGELWETTAMPEVREQARVIAERLVGQLAVPLAAEASV